MLRRCRKIVLFKAYCICLYDVALWKHYNLDSLNATAFLRIHGQNVVIHWLRNFVI